MVRGLAQESSSLSAMILFILIAVIGDRQASRPSAEARVPQRGWLHYGTDAMYVRPSY